MPTFKTKEDWSCTWGRHDPVCRENLKAFTRLKESSVVFTASAHCQHVPCLSKISNSPAWQLPFTGRRSNFSFSQSESQHHRPNRSSHPQDVFIWWLGLVIQALKEGWSRLSESLMIQILKKRWCRSRNSSSKRCLHTDNKRILMVMNL